MTENEFILNDRITKIKSVIDKYGENNFYIGFSGGKDSTVVSALVDLAIPNNNIPRVFTDTGIELNMIRDFVYEKALNDKRVYIIKPTVPIRMMLEDDGYPFKSKSHSALVAKYQKGGYSYKSVRAYVQLEKTLAGRDCYRPCPKILKYQFTDENKLKISDKCCLRLKEEPIENWAREHHKKYGITGIMREEGGRRYNAQCLRFEGKNLKSFHPLAVISGEWENWFIETYKVSICKIYYPPYNFKRTGCKGCPFALNLNRELKVLKKYFPNEYKQCEMIWKPVYDEYRRLNYRIKKGV